MRLPGVPGPDGVAAVGRVLAVTAALAAWLLLVRVLGPVGLLLGVLLLVLPRVGPRVRAWLRPRALAWWQVALGAVVVVGALAAVLVLAPAGRLPLPPSTGTWVTPSYLGRAAVADPLPALAPGPPGPLGDSPEVDGAWFGGADCGELAALPTGWLVAVCAEGGEDDEPGGGTRVLRVLDPGTLRPLVSRELPPAPSGAPARCGRALAVTGDQVVVGTAAGALDVLATTDAAGEPDLTLAGSTDLRGELAEGECLVGVAPDATGLWWAGSAGRVGVVDPADGVASLRLPGTVANPVTAVDGTAYVVTTQVLAAVGRDPAGRLEVRWRSVYDGGTGVRTGQVSRGGGTAPVLLDGTDASGPLLALTDNADPRVQLRLVRAVDGSLVCQTALFDDEASAVEADPLPVDRAGVVVANAAGWTGPRSTLLGRAPAGGLARVDLVDGRCRTTWTSDVVSPSVRPAVSPVSGLVHAWAVRPSWWGVDAWYLTGLDARTGELRFAARAGTGPAYAGRRGGVLLGADAAATVATAGGLVRVVDRFPTLAAD